MIRVCSGNNAATAATKLSMRGDQVRRVPPLRRGLKLESQRADSVSDRPRKTLAKYAMLSNIWRARRRDAELDLFRAAGRTLI